MCGSCGQSYKTYQTNRRKMLQRRNGKRVAVPVPPPKTEEVPVSSDEVKVNDGPNSSGSEADQPK